MARDTVRNLPGYGGIAITEKKQQEAGKREKERKIKNPANEDDIEACLYIRA